MSHSTIIIATSMLFAVTCFALGIVWNNNILLLLSLVFIGIELIPCDWYDPALRKVDS